MRIGELCGLKWEDVDFEKKVLYVRQTLCYFSGDGKYVLRCMIPRRRTIALTEKAVAALKKQRIQKQKILFKGIEIERFSPHCFRHTFATRAIENGLQPNTLQKLLGHGSLQMMMDLYCHVTEDTLFEEMQKMKSTGFKSP